MPKGIGQLNSLQTLTSYVIDSDVGNGIVQLKDLNLGSALSLTELRKVHGTDNAKQGNMSTKHNLKRLSLDWANGPYSTHVGYVVHTNAEGILEALRPHKRLEVLLLSNYPGAKLSSWMHNSTLLEHITELSPVGCKSFNDFPPLWQLPSPRYLDLDSLDSLTSICLGNDDKDNVKFCISPLPLFPKLETMIVSNMPKLERWHQEVTGQIAVVSFPQLKKLNISKCPMLASMPKMLPLLEDLQCKGSISVEPEGSRQPIDLHFSRLRDSHMKLRLKGLMENVERIEEELKRIPCRFIKELGIIDCDCLCSSELSQIQRERHP
ncbi:hypothetical protein VPH35_118671 [Triticum aestivum]